MIGYHKLFPQSDRLVAVGGWLSFHSPIVPNNLHALSPKCCPALLGMPPLGDNVWGFDFNSIKIWRGFEGQEGNVMLRHLRGAFIKFKLVHLRNNDGVWLSHTKNRCVSHPEGIIQTAALVLGRKYPFLWMEGYNLCHTAHDWKLE